MLIKKVILKISKLFLVLCFLSILLGSVYIQTQRKIERKIIKSFIRENNLNLYHSKTQYSKLIPQEAENYLNTKETFKKVLFRNVPFLSELRIVSDNNQQEPEIVLETEPETVDIHSSLNAHQAFDKTYKDELNYLMMVIDDSTSKDIGISNINSSTPYEMSVKKINSNAQESHTENVIDLFGSEFTKIGLIDSTIFYGSYLKESFNMYRNDLKHTYQIFNDYFLKFDKANTIVFLVLDENTGQKEFQRLLHLLSSSGFNQYIFVNNNENEKFSYSTLSLSSGGCESCRRRYSKRCEYSIELSNNKQGTVDFNIVFEHFSKCEYFSDYGLGFATSLSNKNDFADEDTTKKEVCKLKEIKQNYYDIRFKDMHKTFGLIEKSLKKHLKRIDYIRPMEIRIILNSKNNFGLSKFLNLLESTESSIFGDVRIKIKSLITMKIKRKPS